MVQPDWVPNDDVHKTERFQVSFLYTMLKEDRVENRFDSWDYFGFGFGFGFSSFGDSFIHVLCPCSSICEALRPKEEFQRNRLWGLDLYFRNATDTVHTAFDGSAWDLYSHVLQKPIR